jgi:hypothetical protein
LMAACHKEYGCYYMCSSFLYSPLHIPWIAYVLAWNALVWTPRLKLCPLLEPHFYTPLPVLLVLDPSVYQTRPTVKSLNFFCHLHLSRNFTANGLWYTYLGNHPVSPHYVGWIHGPCYKII